MRHWLASAVPVAHAPAINALAAHYGSSDREWSVDLSATGAAPATHIGCCAQVSAQTKALLSGLKAGTIAAPDIDGFASAQITAAIAAVSLAWADDAPGVGGQHWADTLASLGLQAVRDA